MSNREAAAASERPLPPLPSANWVWTEESQNLRRLLEGKFPLPERGTRLFTAEQMHAYVLADRAASAPQAVRMLSDDEIWSCECSTYERSALAIQRKFCEVNGIVPLAPQDSTKEGGK